MIQFPFSTLDCTINWKKLVLYSRNSSSSNNRIISRRNLTFLKSAPWSRRESSPLSSPSQRLLDSPQRGHSPQGCKGILHRGRTLCWNAVSSCPKRSTAPGPSSTCTVNDEPRPTTQKTSQAPGRTGGRGQPRPKKAVRLRGHQTPNQEQIR